MVEVHAALLNFVMFYVASICAYLKVLFGALVEKGWVKNLRIHSSLNSNLLLRKKTSNYAVFYEKVPLCPNYDLVVLMTLISIPQILRKD